MILLLVVVANLLDQQMGATYIRDGVCIAFMANELLSIVENASLMGLPIPKVITDALDVLHAKQSTEGE
jgi:toxin secretion/phage lysis holin